MLKTFAGGQLFGARYGTGIPWVLALPGWERTHRDYDELLSGLDAIALDLPGFGAAPPPPEPWTTRQYADHVAAVLADMGPKVVVVGHSFGGRVATHLAAAHPERIVAQVLTGVPALSAAPGDQPKPKQARSLRVAKAFRRTGLLSEARVEQLRRQHGSGDYRRATGVIRDILVKAVNENYEAPLDAYRGPVELIWGRDDDQAPLVRAEAAAARNPTTTTLRVLDGVGHFVLHDRPDAIIAAVDNHRP
jgi:pimeloyl-ACP methyl ester carboxylesterase